MKKLFLFAVLATLCIYFGCSKADNNEPAPATSNTEVSKHADATHEGGNDQVTSRASCDAFGSTLEYCECECCCYLLLQGPINTNVDLNICGPNIGCPDDMTDCFVGPSIACGVNYAAAHGGTATLNTSSNDHKIFCSGDIGDIFQIANFNAFTVRFSLSCNGSTGSVITLLAGEAAIITKGTECGLNNVCIY